MRLATALPAALALLLCCTVLGQPTGASSDSELVALGRSASGMTRPSRLHSTGDDAPALLIARHGHDEHGHEDSHGGESTDQAASPGADREHHHTPAKAAGGSSSGSEHDHHHSHAAPLKEINETLILLTHSPDPLSYLELDSFAEGGYPGLLIAHVAFMTIGFFVFLPLALFLKAGGSSLALLPQAGFLVFALFGHLFGGAYNSATPDLYPSSSHSRLGWVVMVLTLALNSWDVYLFGLKFKRWFFGGRYAEAQTPMFGSGDEREQLVDEPKDEFENVSLTPSPMEETPHEVNWSAVPGSSTNHEPHVNDLSQQRSNSNHSDDTLFDTAAHEPVRPSRRLSLREQVVMRGAFVHTLLTRSLVLFAYIQVISGIAVYTGSCRERYGNGCIAHTVKGSIFVWYGLLTFARYIGAFSALGWAWNRRPDGTRRGWSAEFVESFVCFLYGATNTWLERLGKTGAYSIKDIQHISIAVMFWFAGALGMLLESQRVRKWLSQSAIVSSHRHPTEISEPASASFSFNPFPALIIGVTGVAMSAHHQTFQFQVDIHALWGVLLGGFAAFRFLTYFFLYLRPPASILPSRPPTEALASLCLTCGGVVFILSTEQVTFAALRNGGDDVMAFLNMTVALVCVWFTWTLALFALKGWATARTNPVAPKASRRSGSMAREAKPTVLNSFA